MKIKILQTPIRFYPYIGGGVENHVYYLLKELVKMGHKVKVICSNEPESSVRNVHGIEVERLPWLFKITNTNITPGLPWEILKSNFDIIHTHMPTPWTCDWSILIGKLKGKKTVLTIHNDMDKPELIGKLLTNIYLNTVFRVSLALVDKIIIVNPNWQNSFINTKTILEKYREKIIVIPNGVDTELFKPLNIKKEKNTILFVSILDKCHKFKGLDYLLKAVKIVKKTIPDIKLLVVGEGELKSYYMKMTQDLEIDDNVEFLGEKTQRELVKYYNKASIFILPSTEIEGFGLVLLESLACGTPVISTPVTGISKEITDNKCGFVVPIRDQLSLARAIETLLNTSQKQKKFSINGTSLIQKKYSWNSCAAAIESTYLEIV